MALKEYKLGDRTYLFDDDDVPEGAELVGEVKESVAPGDFESLIMAQYPATKAAKPADNKRARAPKNKADDSPADATE